MKSLLNHLSTIRGIIIVFLIIAINSSSAVGQVKVDEDSNVGIGTDPVSNASSGYYPKLSILGRINISYPTPFSGNIVIGNSGSPEMGISNILLGGNVGTSLNRTGNNAKGNLMFGSNVGNSLTTGSSNVMIGSQSAANITTANYNVFIGTFTGNNLTGNNNLSFGFGSGSGNGGICTGINNMLIGPRTGGGIHSSSNSNTAVGTSALAEGSGDGVTKIVISENTAIGFNALKNIKSGSNRNVAIGNKAGTYINGSQNIFIGNRAGPVDSDSANPTHLSISNKLYINNLPSTTPLIYGDFNTGNRFVRINGDFDVTGTLTAAVKNFKINHPLSPETKTLHFASIEAPEMINMFRGNIITDAQGFATVTLPEYFSAANIDCSYHLTCIGVFAQAIVSQKVEGNSFVIQTDQPNVEVSWQVLAKRNDTWAQENPLIVEQDKEE